MLDVQKQGAVEVTNELAMLAQPWTVLNSLHTWTHCEEVPGRGSAWSQTILLFLCICIHKEEQESGGHKLRN